MANTFRKCHSTVRGLMNSRLPTSGLDSPARSISAICFSCCVRPDTISEERYYKQVLYYSLLVTLAGPLLVWAALVVPGWI